MQSDFSPRNSSARSNLQAAVFSFESMAEIHPRVLGIDLDSRMRCAHYNTALDIIAIKMKCCGVYYACKQCHDSLAGHAIEVWPKCEWDQVAVLCGACGTELSIRQYLGGFDKCPDCSSPFNPGCHRHYHFYLETGSGC
jgi:uncharacterized CHY-type Zn-finger protein